MSGADIAAEVAAAIAEAGSQVGEGAAIEGVIIRKSGQDESTYPPTPGVDTEYTVTLLMFDYAEADRDGTQITAGDVRAMVAADGEAPQNGDKMRVDGKTFSVVNVDTLQPGAVPLYYTAQLRRA